MEWEKLLNKDKLRPGEEYPGTGCWEDFPINPFEMDYNRIVASASFRRLQDKTQVFPLSKSDFVRTRLTHSIEVSTIAYQLGQMLTENKQAYQKNEGVRSALKPYAAQIPSVLRCAGIIHDLGNPPFGHFGEETIGSWFRDNLGKLQYKGERLDKWLTEREAADLKHFEGNAQALRLLCKAERGGEINVSHAVISALVKYPTASLQTAKSDDPEKDDVKLHKPGVFEAEAEAFQKVSEAVGTRKDNGEYCRHPLTYLMEASDDIAYATSDLEDAYKKQLFTLDEFIAFCSGEVAELEKEAKQKNVNFVRDLNKIKMPKAVFEQLKELRKTRSDDDAFRSWLYYVRRWLMYVVIWKFYDQYGSIMDGSYKKELFADTYHENTVKILKGAMKKYVYDDEALVRSEISGQTIISFLLDGFVKAVLYADKEYQDKAQNQVPTQVDRKYYDLIAKRFRKDYEKTRTGDEGHDLYLRLLMVTDHISGMTDAYARDLFRELRGVE